MERFDRDVESRRAQRLPVLPCVAAAAHIRLTLQMSRAPRRHDCTDRRARRLHLHISQRAGEPGRDIGEPARRPSVEHSNRRHTGTIGERASRIQFKPHTKVADRDMCAIVGIDTHHVDTAIHTPQLA